MNVAFNASVLRSPHTGIGTYSKEIIAAITAFTDVNLQCFHLPQHAEHPKTKSPSGNFVSAVSATLRNVPGAYAARRRWLQHRFDQFCTAHKPALYHDPSLWPLHFDGPRVFTIHDLTHIYYPWTQPKTRLRAIERYMTQALASSPVILVDSQFIGDQVCEYYGVDAQRVIVAPPAAAARFSPRAPNDTQATLAKHGLGLRRFFLSLSTLEPRKNLTYTLRAHRLLPETVRREYPLVLVGASGWRDAAIKKEIKPGYAEGSVKVLGYADNDEVVDLLSSATSLVFPSLYEGFGFPVLEAMACGLPVITNHVASIPEVGGDACYYIDSDSYLSGKEAMLTFIESESAWQKHHQAGLVQAKKFSWKDTADGVVTAYHTALRI